MRGDVFIDSNVWLYAFVAGDRIKNLKATRLIEENKSKICISTQVINEVSRNLLKKCDVNEGFITDFINDAYLKFQVLSPGKDSLLNASRLREEYDFSYWDSLMISSALESGCSTLYSEDMQNGQVINKKLTIKNPFK